MPKKRPGKRLGNGRLQRGRNSNRKRAKRQKQLAEAIRNNGGAPSSYDTLFARQAADLCKLGATDAELADFFNVTITTIWNWSTRHQEFFDALRRGKDAADERVVRALYSRATGYSFDSEKIVVADGEVVRVAIREHVPPSDKAASFWLTNRRSSDWKERNFNEFDPDQPLKIKIEGGLPSGNR